MLHSIRLAVLALLVGSAVWLSACTPQTTLEITSTPTRRGTLIPFYSATPSSTPSPIDRITPSPLPSPTPTMRSHTIQRGQDLGGIAFSYRVSLQALLEANPGVDPYLLVVGSTLNIPPSVDAAEQTPVPTPVAVELSPANCSIGREGGAWCFAIVTNHQEYDVEGVSAIIRVADEKAEHVVSQTAITPLDLLPSGSTLPLAAYFQPRLPAEPLQVSIELLTSLPVPSDHLRYLPAGVENLIVRISEDGLEAEVTGEVRIDVEEEVTGWVRVALVAYNSEGKVIGLRRWDSENPLQSGRGQFFRSWVYSTGAEIERIEAYIEARPDQR